MEGLLHIHEQVNNCIDTGLYQDIDRVCITRYGDSLGK